MGFLANKGFLTRLGLSAGLVCGWLLSALPTQAAELSREDKLKAAYLFHFTRFVRWTELGLSASQPINLCVDSEAAFVNFITDMSDRAEYRGSPNRAVKVISLTQVSDAEPVSDCHMIYMRQPGLHALLRDDALVVGDLGGPYSGQATVLFYPDKQRLRFQVHVDRLEASGIPISSELLKLAKLVP
ncbi:hypothetical protein R50073_34680 [Maricurvus nonylphenolicus]|uniref:YfiR family protein n=1 Tax=Maricurvus nonylphenolicus TaxID=1008307 RepID=UPI0036F3DDD7